MVAGAGAMLEASRAMGRAQRQMERYMRERAQRRRARLRGGTTGMAKKEPLRAKFDCYQLCGDCGFLARKQKPSCPGCGHHNWMDLADHDTADIVRDLEQVERMKTPGWVKGVTLLTAVGLFGGAAAGIGFAWPEILAYAIMGAAGAVPISYAVGHRSMAWLLLRWAARKRPYRWRMPLPLPDHTKPPGEVATGPATPTGEPITSPLSGKKCVAYQMCVLFDTPGDARPPEWVLQETAGADFKIGEHAIAGKWSFVESPLHPVTEEEIATAGLDVNKFLRQRGLFTFDGEFELFEALVEPGDEITARIYAENRAVMIVGKAVED